MSFKRAVEVEKTSGDSKTATFAANIQQEFSINGTPHGGYLLSVIVNAFNHFTGAGQPDPAHLMASFYRAARPGPATVQVTLTKPGKRWTNFDAKLIQNDQTLIFCQALYTKFPPLPSGTNRYSSSDMNLVPLTDSKYAPIVPFLMHPAEGDSSKGAKSDEYGRRWSSKSAAWFNEHSMVWDGEENTDKHSVRWCEDLALKRRREGTGNEERLPLEHGLWCEFKDDQDEISSVALPFFCDIMSSIPELPPGEERITPHYYPTLALSMQFHAPLPLPEAYPSAPRTVGCFTAGERKPILSGRHEQVVEVWSAPGPIGKGQIELDWRKRSMLLASSTQIALSVGIDTMKTGVEKKPEAGVSRL